MPEWIQKYTESFIQPDKLQQIVDTFMADYDKRKDEVRVQLFVPWGVTYPSVVCICDVRCNWIFCLFVSGSREAEKGGWAATRGWRGLGKSHKRTKGHQGPPPQRGGQPEDSAEGAEEEEEEGAHELLHLAAQKYTERTWVSICFCPCGLHWSWRGLRRFKVWFFSFYIYINKSFSDIAELRKKFEEDKQRIALLRAQRKFRPYWTNNPIFPFLISLHSWCVRQKLYKPERFLLIKLFWLTTLAQNSKSFIAESSMFFLEDSNVKR